MTPSVITLHFKEAHDSFPVIEGKPTDDNLLSIQEILLPILMEIPYNQLRGVHSLTAILNKEAARYATDHGGKAFKCPICLPLYDNITPNNATMVVRIHAELAHKSCLNIYASSNAAKRGATKFLCKSVNEVWYNDLKDADTFYTR